MRSRELRCIAALVLFGTASGWSQTNPTPSNYDVTRKTVVFIYAKDDQGKEKPDGTGFLISVPLKSNPSRSYIALVTARHMIDSSWLGCPATPLQLVAKLNKKKFDPQKDTIGTAEYDLKDQQWIFPEDSSVDLAYTFLDGHRFEALEVENGGLNLSNLPSAVEMKAVSVGDDVVSAGLLVAGHANSSGTLEYSDAVSERRNYPVFKFGKISSIPEEKISVDGGCGKPAKLMTEWMVAANLVPGNNGSPIIIVPSFGATAPRWFILGVQSISFMGSDVAGIAPIRYLVDSIRQQPLLDADFSKPVDVDVPAVKVTPTSVPALIPNPPVPLTTPH